MVAEADAGLSLTWAAFNLTEVQRTLFEDIERLEKPGKRNKQKSLFEQALGNSGQNKKKSLFEQALESNMQESDEEAVARWERANATASSPCKYDWAKGVEELDLRMTPLLANCKSKRLDLSEFSLN